MIEDLDKFQDKTLEVWGEEWIRNLVVGERKMDLSEFPSIGEKALVVCGAGPKLHYSLAELKRQRDKVFTLCNQSSFGIVEHSGIPVGAIVVTDANEGILRRIWEAEKRLGKKYRVILATHCPASETIGENYWFNHFLMQDNLPSRLYNEFLRNTNKRITSFIGQAGTVVNASIMVAAFMRIQEKVSSKRIYLAGVDFGFPGGLAHCKQVEQVSGKVLPFEKVRVEDKTYEDPHGFLVNDQMVLYFRDFQAIVKLLKGETYGKQEIVSLSKTRITAEAVVPYWGEGD